MMSSCVGFKSCRVCQKAKPQSGEGEVIPLLSYGMASLEGVHYVSHNLGCSLKGAYTRDYMRTTTEDVKGDSWSSYSGSCVLLMRVETGSF